MDYVRRHDGNVGQAVGGCRHLESALLGRVRTRLQIPKEVDIPVHAPLVELLASSPIGAGSLDLFEAFAKAIVDLEGDLDAELPAFTAMDEVGAVCRKIVQRALAPPGERG